MYALAGVLDPGRGWGRADEAFRCLSAMAVYGAPTWFGLGDRDLATHLVRTRALREGRPLSAVTADLARALGVIPSLLPMSDAPVRTTIRTPDGRLGFQEYFVRDKCQAEVLGVDYDDAACAPELAALGVRAVATDVMMPDRDREIALARAVIEQA